MTNNIRRQLTLFLAQNESETIEEVRRMFNPIQFGLIKAHVTLCREDELQNHDKVMTNLTTRPKAELTLAFGKPIRFDHGNGLLLPATNDNSEFYELRSQVFEGLSYHPKRQEPHITLMHPRNSTCTASIFEQVLLRDLPTKLHFKKVSLIEQTNGKEWVILQEFDL